MCIENAVQDAEYLEVRCGRCGKCLRVRLIAIQDARTIDYADCVQRPRSMRGDDPSLMDGDIGDVECGYVLPRRAAHARQRDILLGHG